MTSLYDYKNSNENYTVHEKKNTNFLIIKEYIPFLIENLFILTFFCLFIFSTISIFIIKNIYMLSKLIQLFLGISEK